MIAFLPVARYRVSYQVASGRPFSSFERLLLNAINSGGATLDSLADLFRLHRRMIIEGIVTLMQAGWVCFDSDGSSFVTTPSGREACETSRELPTTIIVSNRTTSLLMEKVSGQLARGSDLDLHTKQKLERLWTAGVPMPPSDISNIIEPGMIAQLLPHEPGEWVRLIGPISVMTDNRLYAIVDVDIVGRKLTGIPQTWHALLIDELVERATRAQDRLSVRLGNDEEKELSGLIDKGAELVDPSRQTQWEATQLTAADLLVSSDEHSRELKAVLQDAKSYVGIVSCRMSMDAVEAILPDIRSSLQRDILVSVFWCRVAGDLRQQHEKTLEALRKLEYDSNHGQYEGRLVVNTVALGGDFNLLVSDQPGGLQVVFGSYEWLRSPASGTETHSSVRLVRSSVGARLCDLVADLASKEERVRTSSAVTSLRKFASSLRGFGLEGVPDSSQHVEANVLVDDAANWYAHDLIDSATQCVRLGTARGTTAGVSSFFERHPAVIEKVHAVAGTMELPGDENCEAMPTRVSHASDMQANVLLVDGDMVVVSNRPWFDGVTGRGRPYSAAIVLALRGEGITNVLAEKLRFPSPHTGPIG